MKLFAWMRRHKWEREMDSEMRFHLENQIEDYVQQGMNRTDAERRAHREFGGVEFAKDECRDQRPFLWLDQSEVAHLESSGRAQRQPQTELPPNRT